MKNRIVKALISFAFVFTPTFVATGQSCPGDRISCDRCGYMECYAGSPIYTYGSTVYASCWPTTNSCSGWCINPQEVKIDWDADCDGVRYTGSGYTCCGY